MAGLPDGRVGGPRGEAPQQGRLPHGYEPEHLRRYRARHGGCRRPDRLRRRAREDNAHRCADAVKKRWGEAIGVVCDVTDEAQVRAAVARARDAFGGIDILVNGAVVFNTKGVLDMPLGEWTRQIAIILTGTFLCTKHVGQSMIDQGRRGSIINIISTAGHQGEPWNIGYCSGKSGLSTSRGRRRWNWRSSASASTVSPRRPPTPRRAWRVPRSGVSRSGGRATRVHGDEASSVWAFPAYRLADSPARRTTPKPPSSWPLTTQR